MNGNNVTESNPKVIPDDLVHPYLGLLTGIVGKRNTDSILPLLPLNDKKQHKTVIKRTQLKSKPKTPWVVYLEKNCVTAEKLELIHGVRVERDDGVVIIYGFVNDESIGRLLALQDRSTEISLCSLTEEKKIE